MFYPVKRCWQAVFAVPLDDTAGDLTLTIDSPALSQVLIAPELAEPTTKGAGTRPPSLPD